MKYFTKIIAPFFSIIIVLTMIASPVYAERNGIFNASDEFFFTNNDAAHGTHIYMDAAKQTALNQYTSGYPTNGTLVTTWHTNSEATQYWEYSPQPIDGIGIAAIITPNLNLDVGINVVRTNTGTSLTANLYPLIGNYYNDTVFDVVHLAFSSDSGPNGWQKEHLSAPARVTNGVTYPKLYLNVTNQATPVSDGYNTSKYVKFESSYTPIYIFNLAD